MATGYSGKTLAAKLGIKPETSVLLLDGPADYASLLGEAPEGASIRSAAASRPPKGSFELVQLFVKNRAELETRAEAALAAVAPGGALWVSWPKKSSKLFVDLTEDGVREIVLPTGWVDVKVCAVDADWSGLKFLRRRS